MLDLNAIVQDTISNMDHEGTIKDLIEKKVSSTIESVIEASFREYSDFGKGLKEYVEESLNIDFNRLGIEGYHDHILKIIGGVIDAKLKGDSERKLKETLDQIIVEAPKQIKLSEIISMMKEQYTEDASDADNRWENMTCIVQDRNDAFFMYISLDSHPDKSKHSCAFRIGLHKNRSKDNVWEVFTISIDGKSMRDTMFAGPFYQTEKLLYQIHCFNSEFIVDLDDSEIEEACEYELTEEDWDC